MTLLAFFTWSSLQVIRLLRCLFSHLAHWGLDAPFCRVRFEKVTFSGKRTVYCLECLGGRIVYTLSLYFKGVVLCMIPQE